MTPRTFKQALRTKGFDGWGDLVGTAIGYRIGLFIDAVVVVLTVKWLWQ